MFFVDGKWISQEMLKKNKIVFQNGKQVVKKRYCQFCNSKGGAHITGCIMIQKKLEEQMDEIVKENTPDEPEKTDILEESVSSSNEVINN